MREFIICLLVLSLCSAIKADTCGPQDVGHAYTPCFNNTRQAVYYYLTSCVENPTVYTLPTTIYNLPCEMNCLGGLYLPFGAQNCSTCDPGYFTPTGELYNTWTSISDPFKTDCSSTRTSTCNECCSEWQVHSSGTYVDSGNNYGLNNINSNLRMQAYFIMTSGNKIRFMYKVEAESCTNCDGLIFYIDGQAVSKLISQQLKWTLAEYDVTPGYHDLRWTYVKDFSISQGSDRASIMIVETIGTTSSFETCLECPPGSYSVGEGNTNCTLCDYNTFTSAPGRSSCQPCPDGQASFQGASSCTVLPPCAENMYFSTQSQCDSKSLTQTIQYQFFTMGNGKVQVCNPSDINSVSLPSTNTVTCTCPPGRQLNTSTGNCDFCPSGSAKSNGDTSCQICPVGTAAIKSLYYGEWSTIPVAFDNFCTGNCDYAGWVPRGDQIDAGYGSVLEMEAVMVVNEVNFTIDGVFEIQYSLINCENCLMEVTISANNTDSIYLPLAQTDGSRNTTRQFLDSGVYTFTFRYYQFNATTAAEGKARIYYLSFAGVKNGGAIECTPCPAGMDSFDVGSTGCVPCPIGTFSSADGERCRLADPGYYVDTIGSTSQKPCGPNTVSNENRTDCYTTCIFSTQVSPTKTVTYDLNPLYNPDTMNFAGTDDSQMFEFFVNLCSREHTNKTCFNDKGMPIETFACQELMLSGYAVDIGRLIGFNPLPDSPADGLVVSLTNGTVGCAKTYGSPYARRTNITMICDPDAGIGSPRAPANTSVETPPLSCNYYFEWRSQHACPLCTAEDFQTSSSECVNGKKTVTTIRISKCYDSNPTLPVEQSCVTCPQDNAGLVCGGHGSCDDTIGQCHCENNWYGTICNQCNFGYYGFQCLKECPGGASNPCNGHGKCDYGLTGAGKCSCSTGWAGDTCNVCDDGFEGDYCTAKKAQVTDVVPWWGFLLIVLSLLLIAGGLVWLWRSKTRAQYKYTLLLKSQPFELEKEDNVVGLPLDDEEEEQTNLK